MPPTDETLLHAINAGNQDALKVFFNRHQGAIYQFALRTVKSPEDAEEILNEVMLEIWRNGNRYAGRSSVRTWALSIAHNKAVDAVRKKHRHENIIDDNTTYEFNDQCLLWQSVNSQQQQQWIQHCMSTLSLHHRQVVHLAFFEGLSYSDIANITETAHGTIKTRMMHAKNKMLNCLNRITAVEHNDGTEKPMPQKNQRRRLTK